MLRETTLEEISDGKLYVSSDMAEIGCNDCVDCSKCCGGMGNSLILDPYDIYMMYIALNINFNELMQNYVYIDRYDGVILPYMSMENAEGKCGFLDKDGRCKIHPLRPGICRLFPMGRYYENGSFKYFIQKDECICKRKTMVKIEDFLGISDIKKYEKFVTDWHYTLIDVGKRVTELVEKSNMKEAMRISMTVINAFYSKPYNDFYKEFYERLEAFKKNLC